MESRRKRLFCNTCERTTWHELKTKFEHQWDPEQYDEMIMVDFAISIWEIWQCRGCDGVVVQNSEIVEDDEPYEEFYPPRSVTLIKKQDFNKIPPIVDSIYDEVVKAFNNKCYILCSAGLRALLEAVCKDRKIESGPTSSGTMSKNLEGRINGLKTIIPSSIVDNLHGLRFLGNKALHELDIPRAEDLALAIDVMEAILNIVYELNYKSGRLLQNIQGKTRIPTPVQLEYKNFWDSLLELLKSRIPDLKIQRPLARSYQSIHIGYSGIHFEWAFHGRPRKELEVGLHLEKPTLEENKRILAVLRAEATTLEKEIGEKLVFQELWGSKWSRIHAIRREGEFTENLKSWAVETMVKFFGALKPRLDSIEKATTV